MTAAVKTTILTYGRMIRFSHTVFALPFALSAVIMAWRDHPFEVADLFFILLAMVGARSAAMGFNRIVDAGIDKRNPRTAAREIPAGVLKKKETAVFVVASSLVFILAAAMLGRRCFILSFPVLAFLFFYSYTKRFTRFSHLCLGFAIGMAPAGAWIAVTGTLSLSAVLLSLALMTYIAGFDILYACQDIDFDRKEGLFSLPATVGVRKALRVSTVLHLFTLLFLFLMQIVFGMHPVFYIFLAAIAVFLAAEHLLVTPGSFKNIHIAFFHMNSLVSVFLMIGVICEALLR